jgi:hypothetical protein
MRFTICGVVSMKDMLDGIRLPICAGNGWDVRFLGGTGDVYREARKEREVFSILWDG